MFNKVYLRLTSLIIMPYNQITVVIGGIMHIPVIIILLRFIENRFNQKKLDYQ
mgnify:CR=1 FL=1